MTEDGFALRIDVPRVMSIAQSRTAGDLMCNFEAEIQIAKGARTWAEEYFPVCELAVQLVGNNFAIPFWFTSMNMEEEPSFAAVEVDGALTLTTWDGVTFDVSETELAAALRSFVQQVDSHLVAQVHWGIADVIRDDRLRGPLGNLVYRLRGFLPTYRRTGSREPRV